MLVDKQTSLAMEFRTTKDFDEVRVIISIFNKVRKLTEKAGFKKDFDSDETDLIRAIADYLNQNP